MKLQKLYSYVRRALDDYQMIQENDKIAVGISGGKDSLALLYALAGIRKFYPRKFDILAITVDLGFPHMDFSPVRKLCEDLHVEYHIVHTQIAHPDLTLSPDNLYISFLLKKLVLYKC